eukprot:MONOS_1340.1-p1 / transcript=MONOS_1340.1 / gene=MONOS_1340 / organism=Monocercomonoides_exilis_PA203 / gene_product=unspecified product / transcript_product=unspecified product / location=Mono_scaffold00023:71082-72516(-) / protein_length=431 / sequence_SO=supercontig / SO=protein_coding / is_pseudo=false
MTNDSSISLPNLLKAFKQRVDVFSAEEVISSGCIVREWISQRNHKMNSNDRESESSDTYRSQKGIHNILFLGEDSLHSSLENDGMCVQKCSQTRKDDESFAFNQDDIDAVIVGCNRDVAHGEIDLVSRVLSNSSVLFLSTDPDGPHMKSDKCSTIAAIKASCGRDPILMCKPSSVFCSYARHRMQMRHTMDGQMSLVVSSRDFPSTGRVIVIGDSIHTDVAMGQKCGFDTLLTLDGATSPRRISESSIVPTYVVSSLGELVDSIDRYDNVDEIVLESRMRNVEVDSLKEKDGKQKESYLHRQSYHRHHLGDTLHNVFSEWNSSSPAALGLSGTLHPYPNFSSLVCNQHSDLLSAHSSSSTHTSSLSPSNSSKLSNSCSPPAEFKSSRCLLPQNPCSYLCCSSPSLVPAFSPLPCNVSPMFSSLSPSVSPMS